MKSVKLEEDVHADLMRMKYARHKDDASAVVRDLIDESEGVAAAAKLALSHVESASLYVKGISANGEKSKAESELTQAKARLAVVLQLVGEIGGSQ